MKKNEIYNILVFVLHETAHPLEVKKINLFPRLLGKLGGGEVRGEQPCTEMALLG